ncbi:hypothetical protein [Phocaeicola coprocola]|uniref:hypothetical protein n=1 Tax=Phocaeicola coprocola TaxID=310298 RepID=UPI0032C0CA1D
MKFKQRVNYGLQNAIKHPFLLRNQGNLLKKRLDFFLILILFVPKFKKKFLFLQRNRERTDDMILKFPVIDFEKASVLKLYYKTFKI